MPKIKEIEPTMTGKMETEDAIIQQTTGPSPKCITLQQPDGGIQVSFLIDPDVAHRIRRRAGTMSLERYIWENILKRAVTDHVY